jgi:hypothetical protein
MTLKLCMGGMIALFAISGAACSTAQPPCSEGVYLPQATAELEVGDLKATQLSDALQKFAVDERLEFLARPLPKDGRTVVNIAMKMDDETFIHVDNFNSGEKFAAQIYSHEPEKIWKPVWIRLLERIKSVFGSNSVRVEIPPK